MTIFICSSFCIIIIIIQSLLKQCLIMSIMQLHKYFIISRKHPEKHEKVLYLHWKRHVALAHLGRRSWSTLQFRLSSTASLQFFIHASYCLTFVLSHHSIFSWNIFATLLFLSNFYLLPVLLDSKLVIVPLENLPWSFYSHVWEISPWHPTLVPTIIVYWLESSGV